MRPRSRDRIRPSFSQRSAFESLEGAGKTGWPHAPGALTQKKFARARKPQVQAVTTGLPCAVVLRLIRALPGEPALATVISRIILHETWHLHGRARTTRLRRPQSEPLVSQPLHVH